MNLAHTIALEHGVDPQLILLLRHGNTKTRALLQAGGTLEEYTLVQPIDSKYDFHANGKPPVSIVVAIVEDKVHFVYRILDVERLGTTLTLTSLGFKRFDEAAKYKERPARKFSAEPLASRSLQRPVVGWTSPRNAVARYGTKMFSSVEYL